MADGHRAEGPAERGDEWVIGLRLLALDHVGHESVRRVHLGKRPGQVAATAVERTTQRGDRFCAESRLPTRLDFGDRARPQQAGVNASARRTHHRVGADPTLCAVTDSALRASVADRDPAPAFEPGEVAASVRPRLQLIDGDPVLVNEAQAVRPHGIGDAETLADVFGPP